MILKRDKEGRQEEKREEVEVKFGRRLDFREDGEAKAGVKLGGHAQNLKFGFAENEFCNFFFFFPAIIIISVIIRSRNATEDFQISENFLQYPPPRFPPPAVSNVS